MNNPIALQHLPQVPLITPSSPMSLLNYQLALIMAFGMIIPDYAFGECCCHQVAPEDCAEQPDRDNQCCQNRVVVKKSCCSKNSSGEEENQPRPCCCRQHHRPPAVRQIGIVIQSNDSAEYLPIPAADVSVGEFPTVELCSTPSVLNPPIPARVAFGVWRL